jgi:hypothetical protein
VLVGYHHPIDKLNTPEFVLVPFSFLKHVCLENHQHIAIYIYIYIYIYKDPLISA